MSYAISNVRERDTKATQLLPETLMVKKETIEKEPQRGQETAWDHAEFYHVH